MNIGIPMKHNKMMFGMLLVFVFLLSVGLTYAYFNIVVSGNNDATSINTSTGTLNITYNGGAQVVANNIYPGWTTTKTFTVENTGTLTAYYQISFIDLTNTIINNELKMSGTCTGDGCETILDQVVGREDYTFAANISIAPGVTQTYTLTFSFIETNLAQNYNQSKAFYGTINIESSEEGKITLQGTLLDSNGDAIPNATITLHSEVQTTTTDSNGRFEFAIVDLGNHTISAVDSNSTSILSDSISIRNSISPTTNNNQIIKKIASNIVNVDIQLNNTSTIEDLTIKGVRIAQVSAGVYHTLAIDASGNLWAWGYNVYGQLGNGTTTTSSSPVQIKSGTTFSSVTAGEYHTLAIDTSGNLWAWGRNNNGQLGNGTTTTSRSPVQIKSGTTFSSVTAGSL